MTDQEDKTSGDVSQDDSNFFWTKLEKEMKVPLPTYVKNICKLNNLDNPVAFKCIDEATIDNLELFAQESMEDMLDADVDYRQYFGNYHKNPKKFKFVIGDRHLIQKFVEKTQTMDEKFWEKSTVLTNVLNKSGKKSNVSTDNCAKDSDLDNDTAKITSERKEVMRILKEMIISLIKTKKSSVPENDTSNLENNHGENETENDESSQENRTNIISSVSVEHLNVQVSKKEIYGAEGFPVDHTYQVSFNCFYCKKKFSYSKIFDKKLKKYRWILTNYSKHVQSQHLSPAESQKRGKKRKTSVSVLDMFQFKKISNNKESAASDTNSENFQGTSHLVDSDPGTESNGVIILDIESIHSAPNTTSDNFQPKLQVMESLPETQNNETHNQIVVVEIHQPDDFEPLITNSEYLHSPNSELENIEPEKPHLVVTEIPSTKPTSSVPGIIESLDSLDKTGED